MYTYGPYPVTNFLSPRPPLQITTSPGAQYVRIINNSPYELNLDLGGMTDITFPEMLLEDIKVIRNFNGIINITPTQNITSAKQGTSNVIWVSVYYPGELDKPQILQLNQQAVNPTATGNPIYTSFAGVASSAGVVQTLNIFNPANSGVIGVFHAANLFTNSMGVPQAIVAYIIGPDLNLANPTSPVPHIITPGTPPSVMHATWDDVAVGHGGQIIENSRVGGTGSVHGNLTTDLIKFPDVIYLYPGANLLCVISDTVTGNVIALALKWTELLLTPPQFLVPGAVGVATTLINDGQIAGQTFIQSQVTGSGGFQFNFNNDGSGLWQVLQSGIDHQIVKANTSGNPLQLGQAGDIAEVLSQLTVDQLATFVGNIIANGGMNINTIRDAIAGITQISLSNTSPQVSVANDINIAGTLSGVVANFSDLIKPNKGSNQVNGSVGGFVQFETPIWGSGLKILLVDIAGFNSATVATFTFPSAFGTGIGFMGNTGTTTWGFFIGGTAQSLVQVTGLGTAGVAGTSTGETVLHANNLVWWQGISPTSIQIGTTSGAISCSGVFIGY